MDAKKLAQMILDVHHTFAHRNANAAALCNPLRLYFCPVSFSLWFAILPLQWISVCLALRRFFWSRAKLHQRCRLCKQLLHSGFLSFLMQGSLLRCSLQSDLRGLQQRLLCPRNIRP